MSMRQDDSRAPRQEARPAGDGVEKTPTEARAAMKTGQVRWMLAIGLVLVVIALGAVWLSFAARPKGEEGATASRPAPTATQVPSSGAG